VTLLDDILSLACTYVQARQEDITVLQRLCTAAEAQLKSRLRKDVKVEDCVDSFVCAAALLAAADFSAVSAAFGAKSFTAGPISVSREDEKASKSLREQAAMMMAPFCQDAFCFMGV